MKHDDGGGLPNRQRDEVKEKECAYYDMTARSDKVGAGIDVSQQTIDGKMC